MMLLLKCLQKLDDNQVIFPTERKVVTRLVLWAGFNAGVGVRRNTCFGYYEDYFCGWRVRPSWFSTTYESSIVKFNPAQSCAGSNHPP